MIVLIADMKRTLRKAGENLFYRSGHVSTAHQFLLEHIGDQSVIFHHFHAIIFHNVVENCKQIFLRNLLHPQRIAGEVLAVPFPDREGEMTNCGEGDCDTIACRENKIP